jgi:uncharacterized protein
MTTEILAALQMTDGLELAVVFGSVAQGTARFDSDLDIAVRYTTPLDAEQKLELIRALGATSGRPVDLIDLRTAGPIVARQALTLGKRLFGTDTDFASQLSRTLIDYADFAPLVERTLRERREAWMKA